MIKNNKLLFIDGVTRSGKSSICQTIVALTNIEHVDLNYDFEYFFAGLVNKKINLSFAKKFLDSSFSRYTYDRILGRNLNLRKSDFTSIYNYYNPKIYLDRINLKNKFRRYHYKKTTFQKNTSNDNALNFLKSNFIYFPIQSHYLLEHYNSLKKLKLNHKLLRLNRHPVDIIFSYYKRGWGKISKINTNHSYKYASYSVEKDKILIPWFLKITKKKYLSFNEIERCIFSIVSNLKKIKKKYNSNIHFINFDTLCLNPNEEFDKICKFLRVKKQKKLRLFLARANLPRKIDKIQREKKYRFLINSTKNKRLISVLNQQIKLFEKSKT